ncbi:hypothetical protein [Mesorhizobium sp. GbtcB19]|uniref:hypothetical protein n=1 Tax=Mesorhizobium sp. GbtcB19 TaxID=2824764 RepID=UPI001C30E713|nr:hypothetical protein [Mesorhizobium sp. GbtcB19]
MTNKGICARTTPMKWDQWRRRAIFSFIATLLAAMAEPALAASATGTYVGSSPDGAYLMELVEIDGRLTGHYERVILSRSGKLEDTNTALSGAVNNGTVVITIQPTELLSGAITASGTFDGQALHLTGGGDGGTLALNLVQADKNAFQTQVSDLTNRANQLRLARAEADALAHAQDFVRLLDAFSAHADTQLKLFAPTEQNLRTLTGQMRAALAKQQAIRGDGQASVARGQISVWINQADVSASQIHQRIEAAYRDFDSKSAPILAKLAVAVPACNEVVSGTAKGDDPANLNTMKPVCSKLLESAKTFQARVSSVRGSFSHIAAVWNEEHQKQAAIVQASEAR